MAELDDAAGFWSYVHADDAAEGKRITRLAELVRQEFSMLTGTNLEVFVDRDIQWGEEWRRRIDDALSGTAFFVPVITPRYFQSEECRKELLQFSMNARSLGLFDLLMPLLLYVPVDGLAEDSDDEAKALVSRTQFFDWTKLRLEEEHSAAYRAGVNALANRLAEVAATRPTSEGRDTMSADALDVAATDAPGLVDVLASAEESMEGIGEHLNAMAEILAQTGKLAEATTTRMARADGAGKGFKGRLIAIMELATKLDEPAQSLTDLSNRYVADLAEVDAGILTLIRIASEGGMDEATESAREFFGVVREMVEAARATAASTDELIAGYGEMATLSRDLRPRVNRMRDAVRRVRDGQAILDEWERRIEQLPSESAG